MDSPKSFSEANDNVFLFVFISWFVSFEVYTKFHQKNMSRESNLKFDFNPFITGKIEKLDFEMPIIQQTLNINNSRTTRAKSINLHTIRKLIEYSLKNRPIKAIFTPTVFEILMSEGRSVLSPAQRGTWSERVKNNFRKPYKPIKVWLCLVYKITRNSCRSQLFTEFIQT